VLDLVSDVVDDREVELLEGSPSVQLVDSEDDECEYVTLLVVLGSSLDVSLSVHGVDRLVGVVLGTVLELSGTGGQDVVWLPIVTVGI